MKTYTESSGRREEGRSTYRKWVGCLGLPLLLFALCAGFSTWMKHVPDIDDATADELLTYANRVWERPADMKDGERWWFDPKDANWPDSIRGMRPVFVAVTQDGLFITRGEFFVESWGYFVLPNGSTFDPPQRGENSYRHLRGRVYRFHKAG